jgi:hypothetical protein
MVFDGGTVSFSAATSAFTAVLRLSQGVYEIIAVGEQVRNLLDTTKSVNDTMKTVQMLRRRKSHLLMDYEKEYIDHQLDFTEKAVRDVAALIEAQRVDMQLKAKPGSQEALKTRHIKIINRAKFVFQDSPKVGTSLVQLGIATQGLHSVMTNLCAKEGNTSANLSVPNLGKGGVGRSGSSPTRKAPPDYELSQLMHRRQTLSGTQRKEAQRKAKVTFATIGEQSRSAEHSRNRSDEQSLRSFGSWSGETEILNVPSGSDLDDDDSPFFDDSPACTRLPVPISSIYDGIGEDDYMYPTRQMDASAHPPLFSQHSTPVVTTVAQEKSPRPPPKPAAYKTPQIILPGGGSLRDEYNWPAKGAASIVPYQKPLPILPRKPTRMASNTSLNSASSDIYDGTSTPGTFNRGRAYMEYLMSEIESGQEPTVTRTRSLQTSDRPQHSDYGRDLDGEVPGVYRWND